MTHLRPHWQHLLGFLLVVLPLVAWVHNTTLLQACSPTTFRGCR